LLAEISGGRGDRVRLFVNHRLSQPFASSWGRAVIVLPENLCCDEQTLRWCLAHEWAHVDGHDFRTWLLAGLAKVLFFYQPLLWWLRRQLRLCQDFVADSQAARQAPQVEDYAEFLTARAAGRLHPAVVGLSMGCHKSEIYRRVIMLLNNESLESRTPRLWTVSVTVAALLLAGVVAAVSLVPRAVAEEKPAVSQSKEAGEVRKKLLSDFLAAAKVRDNNKANEAWSTLLDLSGLKDEPTTGQNQDRPLDIWMQQPGRIESGWVWVRQGCTLRVVTPDGKVLGQGGIIVNSSHPKVIWNGMLPDGQPGIAIFNAKKGEERYLMFLSALASDDVIVLRLMVKLKLADITAHLVAEHPEPRIELRTPDGKDSQTFSLHYGDLRAKPWSVDIDQ